MKSLNAKTSNDPPNRSLTTEEEVYPSRSAIMTPSDSNIDATMKTGIEKISRPIAIWSFFGILFGFGGPGIFNKKSFWPLSRFCFLFLQSLDEGYSHVESSRCVRQSLEVWPDLYLNEFLPFSQNWNGNLLTLWCGRNGSSHLWFLENVQESDSICVHSEHVLHLASNFDRVFLCDFS